MKKYPQNFKKNWKYAPNTVVSADQLMDEILDYDDEYSEKEEKQRLIERERKEKTRQKYAHWKNQE